MSHLASLVKKELRELITPGTIIPMIVMVIIFASIGPIMNAHPGQSTAVPYIGLMDRDDTSDSRDAVSYIEDYYSSIKDSDGNYLNPADFITYVDPVASNDDIRDIMKNNDLSVLLVIEKGYEEKMIAGDYLDKPQISTFWYQSSSSSLTSMPEGAVSSVISSVNLQTSLELINKGTPEDSYFARSPISYNSIDNNYVIISTGGMDNGTPSLVSSAMMSQNMFVSMIMMLVIIMIGSILISSMGSEKENKTLETLLTLPVSRTIIVGGKLIGSAIVGLIFGAFYLVGMYFSMSKSLEGANSGVDLGELGLSLTMVDWAIIGVFLFMAIMCALGLCMILGAFAKNYKAAQTLIMPVSVLAMIPMFISIYGSLDTLPAVLQAVMFAIPFAHPTTVIQDLMFGNDMIVIAGFVYLLAFIVVTMFITVKLYKSDILLTGFIKKKSKSSFLKPKTPKVEE